MNATDYIVIGIIALIIVAAVAYIVVAKLKGKKCIGCPDSNLCSGKCAGCAGSCGYVPENKEVDQESVDTDTQRDETVSSDENNA